MTESPLAGKVYEAIPEFEDHLEKELGPGCETWGPLFYAPVDNALPRAESFWNRNIWLDPQKIEFGSIGEAAKALRDIQRNWASTLFTQFRRGALIAEKLPPVSSKPHGFPWLIPDSPMGAWTLLDAHTLIASPDCSSPFPAGVVEFEEDKFNPPSRAYLKCWESLARLRRWPGKGERCLDAGASPGGWTWALANLGADIVAVDRAALDPRVEAMPGVSFIKHDAFTLKPEEIGRIDWLFCDVICYPPRLFEWIEKWLASGLCRNFVCTIKMQGPGGTGSDPDFETTRRFAAIPGSAVVHLHHNKHELTWMKAE
ncbi:SAM-dependent methyltransferase [Leadbettera azotonutricia]|uniref:Methyltransferase n=1 Tax=Leadbettera azotonutricia (strain ATCC BAA-888 / DSM 13862 / ZAS-9) TaxID=545695 RepID=F5YBY4_LEAAZ|nr:SAM-dependent methyltransferase [Leadbettera azotonutricia]AEF80232.1 methyltransferase [Leadbettera azotonutricia ZAS-9]